MDALEQLTTVVLPKLVDKIREQKESLALASAALAQDKEILNGHANLLDRHEEALSNLCVTVDDQVEAIRKIYEALKQYKARIETLEERLNAQPAPEVKVRKRRTKKSEAKEEKGEWVIHPLVEKLTGDDILAANYALAATKGNASEAVLLMPDIDDTTMELVARMNSKQIREIVEAHPTTITNIDAKYAKGRWDEVD